MCIRDRIQLGWLRLDNRRYRREVLLSKIFADRFRIKMCIRDRTLTGELWTYLSDLNEQAQERLDTIMEQMKIAEGVTEELKLSLIHIFPGWSMPF